VKIQNVDDKKKNVKSNQRAKAHLLKTKSKKYPKLDHHQACPQSQ
jgi:hypothetical protein